jgi:hypothetical protein
VDWGVNICSDYIKLSIITDKYLYINNIKISTNDFAEYLGSIQLSHANSGSINDKLILIEVESDMHFRDIKDILVVLLEKYNCINLAFKVHTFHGDKMIPIPVIYISDPWKLSYYDGPNRYDYSYTGKDNNIIKYIWFDLTVNFGDNIYIKSIRFGRYSDNDVFMNYDNIPCSKSNNNEPPKSLICTKENLSKMIIEMSSDHINVFAKLLINDACKMSDVIRYLSISKEVLGSKLLISYDDAK